MINCEFYMGEKSKNLYNRNNILFQNMQVLGSEQRLCIKCTGARGHRKLMCILHYELS